LRPPLRMAPLARLALILLTAALAIPGRSDARRAPAPPSSCVAGRYAVEGRELFHGARAARPAVEEAATASPGLVISVAGGRVWVEGRCPPTALRVVQRRRRARVAARWERCEGVAGPVRLRGTLRTGECRGLAGRLVVRGASLRRRFRAARLPGGPALCSADATFDEIQRRIFGPRGCRVQTCHGAAGAGGLDLRPGAAHDELVNAAATNAVAAASGRRRVVPGDPDASFLWQKLTGRLAPGEGTRMPAHGRPLDGLELAVVRAWIEAGAPATERLAAAPCLPREEFQPAPPLPPPPGGHQIVFEGPVLQPGEEVEGCMWARVPNVEDFAVGRWEFSLNPGTHHFAVWEHARGAPPPLNVFRRELACLTSGARIDGVTVTGAPEAPYFVDAYPAGVGRTVKGGSLLGLNPHYHNEFDVPVQIRAWINLHPVTGELRHVAETLISTFAFFEGRSPYSILVPPASTATLRLRYTNRSDRAWAIFQLSSHQHKRGMRVTAWRSDGTMLFENRDWAHPAILDLDPPLRLEPGDWIDYECEHDNGVTRALRRCGDSPEDSGCTPGEPVPLTFGPSAEDEMCFLTGLFYHPG
jgi:hypothetical protein